MKPRAEFKEWYWDQNLNHNGPTIETIYDFLCEGQEQLSEEEIEKAHTKWSESCTEWNIAAFKAGARFAQGRANRELVEALKEIQSEIDRGTKQEKCLGCIDGTDIPDETLCRCCWRIWIGKNMYLLWDWEATQKRIEMALAKFKGGGG